MLFEYEDESTCGAWIGYMQVWSAYLYSNLLLIIIKWCQTWWIALQTARRKKVLFGASFVGPGPFSPGKVHWMNHRMIPLQLSMAAGDVTGGSNADCLLVVRSTWLFCSLAPRYECNLLVPAPDPHIMLRREGYGTGHVVHSPDTMRWLQVWSRVLTVCAS